MDAVKFLNSRLRTCDSYPGCNGCEWKGKPCPGYVTYNPIFATQDERVKPNENVVKKERAEKEMDAVKFLQERARMCNSFSPDCEGCRVDEAKPVMSECYQWMFENPERAVKIVEEWSAAHPRKTRQSVFLEQYPDAKLDAENILLICPAFVYGDKECIKRCASFCKDCRHQFWPQEVE